MRWTVTIIVLWMVSLSAFADSAGLPEPRVFSSLGGRYYLRLVPSADYDWKKTKGYLFRVSDRGDELLYESNGWYTAEVLVSYSGRYMVRTGAWPSRADSPEETPAVVFYEDGIEVRTYYVTDLVADVSKLRYSVSEYYWGGHLSWTNDSSGDVVSVSTVEGKTIEFNIRTSKILD